jgi:putative aldouronate transport system permease protein
MGTSQKRYYAFLFALPALIVVFALRIPPVLQGIIILPFKQYSLIKGLAGSPWIGFANFEMLFSGVAFSQVLINTLVMNLSFFLITIVLSLVIGLSLSHVKNSRLYGAFCVLFMIPFFIPQMYWNMLLFKLFGAQGWMNGSAAQPKLYLADAGAVRLMYIAIETIRWTGLFASAIAFAARKALQHERVAAAFKAVFSITLLSSAFILVTDFELLHPLVNPFVYEKMDTLTLYGFRTVLMMGDLSLSASQWLLQFLFCFLVLAFLLFIAGGFIKNSLFPNGNRELSGQLSGQPVPSSGAAIIPAVYSLFLLFVFSLLIYSASDMGKLVPMPLLIHSGVIYTILAVISSFIGVLLAVLLAYPLTTATPLMRKLYTAVFLILIAAGQFGIHDYIHVRSLGMVNTYFPILLAGMFNPVSVIILGTYYNQKTGDTPAGFGQYIVKSFPVIACLFIGTLLLNMDSYTSSLVYMTDPSKQSPTVQVFMGINRPR